jgi:hypothetical protein
MKNRPNREIDALEAAEGRLRRQDGAADNPVAPASMTDLVLSLVLRGILHNYPGTA